MKKLSLHPACKLFPQLPKDELRALAADIKANGLQNSIVLYEGKILDGRNRWLACKIAKVKPTFVQWNGSGSPLAWVLSENLVRRHLTSSQRAVIALDILPMLEEEAKDRQRLSQGRGKHTRKSLRAFSDNGRKSAANILSDFVPHRAAACIARHAGLSPDATGATVTASQRAAVVQCLHSLQFPIRGTRIIEEAIVTAGGVTVEEVDSRTMQSKLAKGLFIGGELLDIDAGTGGFNLQAAFSTGFVAGCAMVSYAPSK